MRLRIPCPNPACAVMFAVADSLRGKRVRCPRCRTAFTVPAEGGEPAASGGMPVVIANMPATVGRYQVRARLGAGASGTVYRAYDPQLDREVAVKLLKPETLASPQAVERFQREARAAARILHPNIVPVYDAGPHGESQYIASAYIAGQALADAIPEGGIDPRRAATLVAQLADALAAAHKQGVLHRDVKPANILLDTEDRLYLMDFGLAGWMQQEHTQLTQEGAVMGTPAYMAPEQAAGDTRQVGPASDLYGAGVVLYQLLTGRVPFEGPAVAVVYHVLNSVPAPPGQLRPGLDPALEVICLQAMAKRPEDRYASCQEFAIALRGWLTGQAPLLEVPDSFAVGAVPRNPSPPTQSNARPGQETPLPVLPLKKPPKRPAVLSEPELVEVRPVDDPELVTVQPARKKPTAPRKTEDEDAPRAPRPFHVLLWTVLFLGGGVGLAAGGVAALLYFLQSKSQPERPTDLAGQYTATLKDLNDFANGLEGPAEKGDARLSAAALAEKIDNFRFRINDLSERVEALSERTSADNEKLKGYADEIEKVTRRITTAARNIWNSRKGDPAKVFTAVQRLLEAAARFADAGRGRKPPGKSAKEKLFPIRKEK